MKSAGDFCGSTFAAFEGRHAVPRRGLARRATARLLPLHKRYFWFSPNVFFVAGEPAIVYLFPVYLFYYLFIIYYPQCQIHYLFIWCCVENFIWHCAGESDVVRPSFHHIIKLPPIFINLVKVNAYGLIVPMAYPTALHKFLQGLRVWLLW